MVRGKFQTGMFYKLVIKSYAALQNAIFLRSAEVCEPDVGEAAVTLALCADGVDKQEETL